ncbi:MAG: hypothetical protein H6R05_1162 [Burkholderiaceae bacterium]|nr:hypothetical protein [Burkholderiaceae bacterium]
MNMQRKEGVVIVAITIFAFMILTLLTDSGFIEGRYNPDVPFWVYLGDYFSRATIGYKYPEDCDLSVFGCDIDVTVKILTIIMCLLPVLIYGLLRAFGIVKRIFDFEEKLSDWVSDRNS